MVTCEKGNCSGTNISRTGVESEAVEGGVYAAEGAGGLYCACAVAGDGEAGGAGEGEDAVGGCKGYLDRVRVGVGVSNDDLVAVGAVEDEGVAADDGLGREGNCVNRRVIGKANGVNGDVDGVAVV